MSDRVYRDRPHCQRCERGGSNRAGVVESRAWERRRSHGGQPDAWDASVERPGEERRGGRWSARAAREAGHGPASGQPGHRPGPLRRRVAARLFDAGRRHQDHAAGVSVKEAETLKALEQANGEEWGSHDTLKRATGFSGAELDRARKLWQDTRRGGYQAGPDHPDQNPPAELPAWPAGTKGYQPPHPDKEFAPSVRHSR